MVEQPHHLQDWSLGYSASSCSFQEYAGHAHLTSFLESAFQLSWASALMDCLPALVKRIQQHFCTGFAVRPPIGPAEDLWVVVVQARGDWYRSQVFFHVGESLDHVLEDQAYMLLDSKVTGEEVRGDVLAHLDWGDVLAHLGWHKRLFSCSSAHPRTSVCKGRPHCFPNLQMQECVVATPLAS